LFSSTGELLPSFRICKVLIEVNRLLTTTIKVNIAPTAESQARKKGHGNEKEAGPDQLLGLAAWWRLVRRRISRLRTELVRAFGQQKQTVTNARLTGGRFRSTSPA
jgi:hypothetical protein